MQPLVFEPLFKRIRWGGRRLGTVLGKPIGPESDFAESWEVSDHGVDQSIVRGGTYAGRSLAKLVQEQNLPLLGRSAGQRQFPLLVKYLDATDTLSVQVHPNDALAVRFDPAENGKTEAWVIIEAAPESRLYVGLHDGVTASDVRTAVAAGRIESLLHTFEVQAGDCVFVPAGTAHAIGAGVLLAEIQQSSDLTFRLFDWDWLGTDGRPRPLHLEQALQCMDFTRGPIDPVTPEIVAAEHSLEALVNCDYFTVHRHRSESSFTIGPDESCHILMVLGGSATLRTDGPEIVMPLGQTVVLPAEREDVEIVPHGEVTLLDAILP